MAIAGALVVPVSRDMEDILRYRLKTLPGVEIEAIGPKGIAVVMEAEDTKGLEEISADISKWEEVLDVGLAYLNWEDDKEVTS